MKFIYWVFFIFFINTGIQAQREYEKDARLVGIKSLDRFKSFLALANDASNIDEIKNNINWAEDQLKIQNFNIKILKTSSLPLMIANLSVNEKLPTIAFYMHLDGQAVDISKWDQEDPYKAVLKKEVNTSFKILSWDALESDSVNDLRIFARSSSDDKGPFLMLLTALEYLKNKNKSPAFNIKLILDFEEEQSSPGLPEAVRKYKNDLLAELLLILDGPMHSSGLPTLVFGNRGIAKLTLTTYGPKTAQHSGHYGNYIPNPALELSKVLSSMKDDSGRVVVPNFYKGVNIDSSVKKILDAVPSEDTSIKSRTQISNTDRVGKTYQESIQYPSLNIRGMRSGWIGKEARTIIPATATAEIDIRLVIESDPVELISGVKKHIQNLGYTVLNDEPTKEERLNYTKIIRFNSKIAYPAFRTNTQGKEGKWLSKIIKDYYNVSPVIIRTSGGSVPISPFVSELGVPAIGVPTVNLDNNQHSPNENLKIGNYLNGIETFLAILTSRF